MRFGVGSCVRIGQPRPVVRGQSTGGRPTFSSSTPGSRPATSRLRASSHRRCERRCRHREAQRRSCRRRLRARPAPVSRRTAQPLPRASELSPGPGTSNVTTSWSDSLHGSVLAELGSATSVASIVAGSAQPLARNMSTTTPPTCAKRICSPAYWSLLRRFTSPTGSAMNTAGLRRHETPDALGPHTPLCRSIRPLQLVRHRRARTGPAGSSRGASVTRPR